MTIPALNVNGTRSVPLTDSPCVPEMATRLATRVSSTENGGQHLNLVPDFTRPSTTSCSGVQIPLYHQQKAREGDRISDVNSFAEHWGECYAHLTHRTLTEREVLQVLKSGILQTPLGASLKPVFVEATIRAIKLKDDLTAPRLREIVDVICNLPPGSWADALGETLCFPQGTDSRSVAGFIQASLSQSLQQREEKIASGELLTDAQWQCFRQIIDEGPSGINDQVARWLEEAGHDLPSMDLEDIHFLRPSTEAALGLLKACLQVISDEELKARLVQLRQCLEEKSDPVLQATGRVEETVNLSFKMPFNAQTSVEIHTDDVNDATQKSTLLATLEELERKSDFKHCVDTGALEVPRGGLWHKVLYALKVADDISKLPGPIMNPRLRVRPLSSFATSTGAVIQPPQDQPLPQPSFAGPLLNETRTAVPDDRLPQALAQQRPVSAAEQFARQIDDLLERFTHLVTGYRPAEAWDVPHPRSLLNVLETLRETVSRADIRTPLRNVQSSSYGTSGSPYANTVETLEADTSESLRAALAQWLQTTSAYLVSAGVMTFNGAIAIAQQNPRAAATVALVAAHAAVHEFYSRWLRDSAFEEDPHFIKESDRELRQRIIDDLDTVLSEMPDLKQSIKERLDATGNAEPNRDPQLIPDIKRLLSEPVPLHPDQTYAQWVDESVFESRNRYAHLQFSRMEIDEDGNVRIETQDIPARSDYQDPADSSAQWVLEVLSDEQITLQADQNLKTRVLERLESARNMPLSVPKDSSMNRPLALYQQTLNDPAVLAWFESKGLVLDTVNIYQDSVSGTVIRDGVSTTQTFTRWDASGWWQVSAQVLAARQVLDPGNFGLPFVDDDHNLIPCAVILDFFKVVPPSDDKEAGTLASHLKKEGWPEITPDDKAAIDKECEEVTASITEKKARAQLNDELKMVTQNLPDDTPLSLSGRYTRSANHLPLADKCSENLEVLNEFLKLPKMLEICKGLRVDCIDSPVRISDNHIQVMRSQQWYDLTASVTAESALKAPFDDLLKAVKETGNALYSTLSMDLQQVIDYRGFGSPKTVGEIRNVMRWLNTTLPSAPPLGDYSAELLGDTQSSMWLTSEDRAKIINLEKGFSSDSSSIIDALGADLLLDKSVEYRRSNVDELLGQMFANDQADAWGHELINALNWYGAGSTTLPEHNQKLLLAAIKLKVDPDAPGKPGTVAGYDVYQPKNLGRDLTTVRAEIEKHLVDNKGVSALAAPLVAHVFLADAAPEFLVQDPDSGPQIGTASWMTLRLGTAIAEIQHPGCSRAMNTEQLMALAVLDPTTPEQQLLFKTAAADIVLSWGVMNGVVAQRADALYSSADYVLAANRFASQRAELSQAIEGFKTQLLTRKEIAVRELGKIFPFITKEPVEEIIIKADVFNPLDKFTPIRTVEKSLVEAYMEGDLFTLNWKVSSAPIREDVFRRAVSALPVLGDLLTRSVDSFFSGRKNGFLATTKSLIAALPLETRQCLEQGEVKLFTVREETGKPKEDETLKMQAALRGRHGTLLRCEHQQKVRYFECFPGRMLIIERTDLPMDLLIDGVIKTEQTRVSRGGTVNVDVQRGTELPFDFSAYSQGEAPIAGSTSKKLIIEQLGSTLAGTTGQSAQSVSVPDSYGSSKTAKIVDRIINGNYLQGERDFLFKKAKGQTTAEENRAYWEKVENFLLKLIPFVGCTDDLQSGDRMRFINGAFGCFTDLISSLSTLAGGATRISKGLSAVAPISIKAFEAVKVTGSTLIALINPLDGMRELVAGGGRAIGSFRKFLTSGAFALTESGTSHLQTCVDRLRGFFGGMASGTATRVPRSVTTTLGRVNGTHAVVTQINNKWYALDNKGNPIGRALDNSKVRPV